MSRVPYCVVDALASEDFRGNPPGVCPLDAWPPDGLLQAVAAENNLAGTAFVVAAGDDYHLRWFTPTQEVPLCGHGTLAAAFVISSFLRPGQLEVRFRALSGELLARRTGADFELDFPALAPSEVRPQPRELVEALGVVPDAVLVTAGDTNYYAT